jgi:hypothetical protein
MAHLGRESYANGLFDNSRQLLRRPEQRPFDFTAQFRAAASIGSKRFPRDHPWRERATVQRVGAFLAT